MLSLCTAYIPSVPHNSHLSEFLHLHWFSPYPYPRNQPITILPTYHPCLHGMLACRQANVNAFTYPLFHSQFAVHRNSIVILIDASSTFSFLLKFIFLPSLTYLFTQVFLFASTQNKSYQFSYSPPILLTSNCFNRISLTSTCEKVAWWINGTFSLPPLFLRTPSPTYSTAYTCLQ
jgi:hypothetical protein